MWQPEECAGGRRCGARGLEGGFTPVLGRVLAVACPVKLLLGRRLPSLLRVCNEFREWCCMSRTGRAVFLLLRGIKWELSATELLILLQHPPWACRPESLSPPLSLPVGRDKMRAPGRMSVR